MKHELLLNEHYIYFTTVNIIQYNSVGYFDYVDRYFFFAWCHRFPLLWSHLCHFFPLLKPSRHCSDHNFHNSKSLNRIWNPEFGINLGFGLNCKTTTRYGNAMLPIWFLSKRIFQKLNAFTSYGNLGMGIAEESAKDTPITLMNYSNQTETFNIHRRHLRCIYWTGTNTHW